MKNKQAFTLIELLVVVLIIGILAAVALPQYTQAVEKSRFATYRTLADSMAQAADVFYLANGTWPTSLDDLSMEFPADMSTETSIIYQGSCRKNNKMYCCMYPSTAGSVSGAITCGDKDYHLAYTHGYATDDGTPRKKLVCVAKDTKYKAICKAISGKEPHLTASLSTPDSWIGGYSYYEID